MGLESEYCDDGHIESPMFCYKLGSGLVVKKK